MKRLMTVILLFAWLSGAVAQFEPEGTECIAPADPGGGWDFTCRVPGAQIMSDLELIPGSMQVTNMPGAGGAIGFANVVTQREGDDNLIVAGSTATATRLAQNVYSGFTADNVRWLGAVGADFGIIAVAADSPYEDLESLVTAMQETPQDITFAGGSATGGWDHLKVLLLAQAGGVEALQDVRYIAFDGGGAALIELIGGRVTAFTGDASEILSQVEAGEVRVLGVLGPERIDALGDVPTAQEAGYDVDGTNWRAFYGPPGMSDEAYDFWVDAVSQVAESEEWAQLREQNGLSAFSSFGDEFTTFVNEQVASIQTISEELGLIQE